jgi:hypothetical protein
MNQIQTVTAIVVLTTGVVLSYIDYFVPPIGQIEDSVLAYLAHTMMFAGSILGVKTYMDYRLPKK